MILNRILAFKTNTLTQKIFIYRNKEFLAYASTEIFGEYENILHFEILDIKNIFTAFLRDIPGHSSYEYYCCLVKEILMSIPVVSRHFNILTT